MVTNFYISHMILIGSGISVLDISGSGAMNLRLFGGIHGI